MYEFEIAETKTFVTAKEKINQKLYQKINDVVYPQLRNNPYFGTNNKKLKGDFEGFYRYRTGNHRLFYLVDNQKVIVFVVDVKHRTDAYR